MPSLLRSTEWRPRFREGAPGRVALVSSILLHLVALAILHYRREPEEPDERRIELALVSPGEVEAPGATPSAAAEAAPPTEPPRPQRPPRPRVTSQRPPVPLPPAPTGAPAPAPTPPDAAPPASFRSYRQANASRFLPSPASFDRGGSEAGEDLATRYGRDRCEPPAHSRPATLYLLFDASGSMDGNGRADALSCAQQYARAALDRGASIVVGTFARDAVFAPPTRAQAEVDAALRAAVQPDATVLPGRQLGILMDQLPTGTAELVLVSDGWFLTSPEVLVWFRYFLDVDPDNRATLYTVRSRGHREAVERLRGIGFDVFEYDPVRY